MGLWPALSNGMRRNQKWIEQALASVMLGKVDMDVSGSLYEKCCWFSANSDIDEWDSGIIVYGLMKMY